MMAGFGYGGFDIAGNWLLTSYCHDIPILANQRGSPKHDDSTMLLEDAITTAYHGIEPTPVCIVHEFNLVGCSHADP